MRMYGYPSSECSSRKCFTIAERDRCLSLKIQSCITTNLVDVNIVQVHLKHFLDSASVDLEPVKPGNKAEFGV